ncbi:MAG: acyloxyacyl hydrolase [Syntrophales bacterium]|nr:acyloxyacyl hydrolase [Syntrophales bacterium]
MKKRRIGILSVLFFLLILGISPCIASNRGDKSAEIGYVLGIGYTHTSEGNYHPILAAFQLTFNLKISPSWHNFYLLLEPQVNPAVASQGEIESGVGLGFKYVFHGHRILHPYLLGTFGPHYITFRCPEQENGFLFASTLEAGVSIQLDKKSYLQFGYRFRHLSNGGLNSHFFTTGYFMAF